MHAINERAKAYTRMKMHVNILERIKERWQCREWERRIVGK